MVNRRSSSMPPARRCKCGAVYRSWRDDGCPGCRSDAQSDRGALREILREQREARRAS